MRVPPGRGFTSHPRLSPGLGEESLDLDDDGYGDNPAPPYLDVVSDHTMGWQPIAAHWMLQSGFAFETPNPSTVRLVLFEALEGRARHLELELSDQECRTLGLPTNNGIWLEGGGLKVDTVDEAHPDFDNSMWFVDRFDELIDEGVVTGAEVNILIPAHVSVSRDHPISDRRTRVNLIPVSIPRDGW